MLLSAWTMSPVADWGWALGSGNIFSGSQLCPAGPGSIFWSLLLGPCLWPHGLFCLIGRQGGCKVSPLCAIPVPFSASYYGFWWHHSLKSITGFQLLCEALPGMAFACRRCWEEMCTGIPLVWAHRHRMYCMATGPPEVLAQDLLAIGRILNLS